MIYEGADHGAKDIIMCRTTVKVHMVATLKWQSSLIPKCTRKSLCTFTIPYKPIWNPKSSLNLRSACQSTVSMLYWQDYTWLSMKELSCGRFLPSNWESTCSSNSNSGSCMYNSNSFDTTLWPKQRKTFQLGDQWTNDYQMHISTQEQGESRSCLMRYSNQRVHLKFNYPWKRKHCVSDLSLGWWTLLQIQNCTLVQVCRHDSCVSFPDHMRYENETQPQTHVYRPHRVQKTSGWMAVLRTATCLAPWPSIHPQQHKQPCWTPSGKDIHEYLRTCIYI